MANIKLLLGGLGVTALGRFADDIVLDAYKIYFKK